MFDEQRDQRAPAWAWLRGFAYFLLAWPLLSLYAADELLDFDWQSLLAAVLGPAAIGALLLGLEWALTKLFARRVRLAQTPPSTLRDISNLGVCIAVLVIIDVGLVSVFDDEQIVTGGDMPTALLALQLAGVGGALALVFRSLHRLVHGPARVVDLGDGWDRAPTVMRLFGYLTLIPTLLVATVMLDYQMHQRSEFGPAAWVAIPLLLWLGLRSAMARAPRWWATSPWQAWQRQTSLALPWWVVALALGLGLGVLFLLLPTGLIDGEDMTTGGRIAAGVIGIPLGLIVLFGVGTTLFKGLPALLREWQVARLLAREPAALRGWARKGDGTELLLRLADGREVVFDMGADVGAMVTYLTFNRRAA
jgi:hypothetical protein